MTHLPCPFCGDVPISTEREPPYTHYIVGCDNDDCAVEPKVSGMTQDGAWAKWDKRVDAKVAA